MKKFLVLLLALSLFAMPFAANADGLTPGEYEATAQGFGGPVTVKITVDETGVTGVVITGDAETPGLGAAAIEGWNANGLAGITSADDIDAFATATITTTAVKEAAAAALAQAAGEAAADADAPLAFTAGTYEATADGYNCPSTFAVTFSESALTGIEVVSSTETGHVGDIAFGPMIEDMIAANGSGVDAVAGATFSARALRNAVNDAAQQAGCTNRKAFQAAKVTHEAQADIDVTYDVVIVGAGGAGIAAAAQAAQDGNTVLIIEKNAEVGGNTLVSGGQYQSVMPYLVWDPADPDASTGVYAFNGETYNKVKSVQGCINELKMILNWSEEPLTKNTTRPMNSWPATPPSCPSTACIRNTCPPYRP